MYRARQDPQRPPKERQGRPAHVRQSAEKSKSERSNGYLELTHQFKCFVALCDLLHREVAQTLEAECFHTKTGEHASVNHRFAEVVKVYLLHSARQIPSHAAGKGIPCPGRIVNVFQRVCATAEELISLAKKQCAMLTFFYRNVLRSHLADGTPGLDEAGLLRYLARFAVVQDKKIHPLKERIQVRSRCLNPEVHGISDYETRALHLLEHVRLQ